MQLWHERRPGHCNMQHWRYSSDWSCMCVSWSLSYSTLFRSDLLPPPSELMLHSCKSLLFLSALRRYWGTSGTCMSGVQTLEVRWGNTFPCAMYYFKFLEFFQFGENIQWITEGFALWRMCSRCVDIDHSCIKSPWVYHNSDLHLLPISTKVLWCSTVLKHYRLLMFDGSCCQMFSGYKQNIGILLHTFMQLAWRRPLEQC